ncbi:hypothetical protein NECAME_00132 [Necator americanus]|uniref:Rhodanese domain-containing protein n=1 Tax=Necator americanus TaxID=51031 RepID=W2TZN5_NECAM|nr:hypothetical protein NECAME_00132 [Necator americanus]ETN87273.1 hypothetical protein NECAME_00132 [Necator americanus]
MGDDVNSESTSTIGDDCFVSFMSDAEGKKMLWVRLLGVQNRPNPLDDWDQLYNLNNQVGLRNDCRKLAKLLDNKKSVPELESFMTLYCKKRNVDYKKDSGWIVVLEKILKFELPQEHLFNVFFAFTTKYIPKETKENAQIYDLFRLLLQYHDPQIREEALAMLTALPNQLTIDDVPDFVQLSAYYADRTPQCVREASNIAYFVIDCRSNEAYNSGHIYGSFNLDCQLLVDAPSQFEMALSCLESYKNDQKFEEHICFFGYGDEDLDQFMNMVIARFLRDGKSHVTFAQGGYHGLHMVLSESNRLRLINSHDESKCRECGNASAARSWKLVGKVKEVVISKSAAVKDKVSELVTQASPGYAPVSEVKHVVSADRYGKRYRNERSVFSIDDDSSDESGGALFNKANGKEELLLADQAEFIERFQCHELGDGKLMIPSHIAITRTHMHVLRDVDGKPGFVTTEARHALSSVLRVTSKKKVPELLTFKFGYEINGNSKITAVHKFLVPKAGECAKAVKTAIFALRPLSDSESTEINFATS